MLNWEGEQIFKDRSGEKHWGFVDVVKTENRLQVCVWVFGAFLPNNKSFLSRLGVTASGG